MLSTGMQVGEHTFEWGTRTYVMGILNVTPDSFSGDGILARGEAVEVAMEQAREYLAAGADILDVGGESTRPGGSPVGVDEELSRVIPVIRSLRENFPDALISIDTYKAAVAEQAIGEGAQILNDVWALRADPELAAVAARRKTPVILMHNRSNPVSVEVRDRLGKAYVGAEYGNLLEDVRTELLASVELAHNAGITDSHIILDPGIGFGKTVEHNLELINRLDQIQSLGYPVLVGPSRKSFIGFTLDLPAEERLEGTAAAVAVGIVRGADIVRVHDVLPMTRVARMTDALVRGGRSG